MSTGFFAQYGSEIATLSVEHLWLTGAAMLFATAIAVPAGVWLTRAPRWANPVIGAANVLQTIPSLAMFGFLLPLPWLGERAARIAIVALTAYALLPIVRNTYAGIRGIDPAVVEVARALGLTDAQRCSRWSCRWLRRLFSPDCAPRPLLAWASLPLPPRWERAGSAS